MERFILEVAELDSLNRVKRNSIVGVYRSLAEIEAHKQQQQRSAKTVWSIRCWTDPAHCWSVTH